MRYLKLALAIICLCVAGCGKNYSTENRNPSIEKMHLTEARKIILKEGWAPVETFAKNEGDKTLLKNSAASTPILNAGFIELEYCSGVGPGYCVFNYKKDGTCLRLISIGEYKKGEYEPAIHSMDNKCPENELIK